MSEGYLGEIFEQPRILAALAQSFAADHAADLSRLRPMIETGAIGKIVLTGMGGSHHSLYPMLLALSRRMPVPVSLWDCSELIQQAPEIVDERTLLVAVSQSGESGELVRLCQSGQRPRLAIAVTSAGRNTLADWADISVRTNAGPERTASTKTYTAGLAALALLTSALLAEPLEAPAAAVADVAQAIGLALPTWRDGAAELADFLGADAPIAFIGRGAGLATAWMGALLTNEASKLVCPAYSGGQFRHGPIELVRAGFRAIVFESPDAANAALDRAVADTILKLGGKVLWVGTGAPPPHAAQRVVALPVCDPAVRPVLDIVPIQLLQVPLAIARGFVPAQFLNATKVTTGQ